MRSVLEVCVDSTASALAAKRGGADRLEPVSYTHLGSEVLWVCGAGFAEGLAPDEDTAQVLQMEMEHREELS